MVGSRIIETKVALPALVTGLLGTVGGAIYALLEAYEVVAPTPEQQTALATAGAAVIYVVHVVTGYLAPHTSRPDLPRVHG